MNHAGRGASVAPDSITALSCSLVTDRSWLLAGMTPQCRRTLFRYARFNTSRQCGTWTSRPNRLLMAFASASLEVVSP